MPNEPVDKISTVCIFALRSNSKLVILISPRNICAFYLASLYYITPGGYHPALPHKGLTVSNYYCSLHINILACKVG